jgi:uncharacterized protein (UPF0332 family)
VTKESAALLDKADHALRSARLLPASGETDAAINRAYYALFYAASALLSSDGARFRKHAAVHAAFGERFAKTGKLDPRYHRWLLDGFDLRSVADYGADSTLTAEDAKTLLEHAEESVRVARTLF